MTQRQFDIENEKDMQDLWDILPDDINKIEKYPDGVIDPFAGFCTPSMPVGMYRSIIKINWHDKTEITRPIQEATKAEIGKICYFWDNDGVGTYGKLSSFILEDSPDRKFGSEYGSRWQHARRLNKQEIEELC